MENHGKTMENHGKPMENPWKKHLSLVAFHNGCHWRWPRTRSGSPCSAADGCSLGVTMPGPEDSTFHSGNMWKLIENKAIQSHTGRFWQGLLMFIGVLGFFFEDVSLDVSVAFKMLLQQLSSRRKPSFWLGQALRICRTTRPISRTFGGLAPNWG